MIPPAAFLERLSRELEGAGIPWMITGSTASAFYGEPRATQDLDIVLDPAPQQFERLLAALSGGFYVSLDEARQALRERGMFNVIDLESGWKAGLIICPDRAFNRLEMARRQSVRVLGLDVFVISPEGSILSKLEWAKLGGSERQLRDAASVIAAYRASLDWTYLRQQANSIGVVDLLEKIEAEGSPSS
jgi:hypothetical protein